MSYQAACKAVAEWIADARCENARDMDDDVTTWDNSGEDVIMAYLKEMAVDIGKLVPGEIATILDSMEDDDK